MSTRQSLLATGRIASFVLLIFIVASSMYATTPTERVIYKFQGMPDGASPQGGLVADAAGNLYGTVPFGRLGAGMVFELSPPAIAGNPWIETDLDDFGSVANDGNFPSGTLIFDKLGNLYGTTEAGGVNNAGTVFELSPPATTGGAWTETILSPLAPKGADGSKPTGKLVMDTKGNLYGTTSAGGNNRCALHGCGTVFELAAPTISGTAWKLKVIYNFAATNDGATPAGDLLLRNGVLYGTTTLGGAANCGTVFKLTSKPGLWTETILYNFTASTDGANPNGGLISDSSGILFGTTVGTSVFCSENCTGTIYEISPPATAGDPWVETTLHNFVNPGDGKNPYGALWRDSLGNLYGTTLLGGKGTSNIGTVFKLKAPATAGAPWTFVVLHYFRGVAIGDGANPYSGLAFFNGKLYGTTISGGATYTQTRTGGTVYSVIP